MTTITLPFLRTNRLHHHRLNLSSAVTSSESTSNVGTMSLVVLLRMSLMLSLVTSLMESRALSLALLPVQLASSSRTSLRTTAPSAALAYALMFLPLVACSAISLATRLTGTRFSVVVMLLSSLQLGASVMMTLLPLMVGPMTLTPFVLLMVLSFLMFVKETVRVVRAIYQRVLRILRCSCMSSLPFSVPQVLVQVPCTNIPW